MTTPNDETRSEREQTDESLRVEREKVDGALLYNVAAIDETADAVITRARARADQLLAAARAKTDRLSAAPVPSLTIERERLREDDVVRSERANADEVVREERAEHVALLSLEREETDKDLLSERARSDRALATRDEFLGVVGHDLRNMLSSVVGFAALIEQNVARADQAAQVLAHAKRIQRSAGRMNRLIGDLVDVATIEAGMLAVSREIGDPSQVVMEAVETFQPQAAAGGVTLTAEIVPPMPLAAFDTARILQVIANLLTNAIKFTPAGGKVVVHLERVGDELRVAVRDTGVGIPANKLEAVFERFLQVAQNDRRGVGLGLYISKCIVQGHGGKIWAESVMGQGSTFCFTLPVQLPPA